MIERLHHIAAHIHRFPVMPFKAFPATYSAQASTAMIAQLLSACVAQGIRGLVLESYGTGNFPSGSPGDPSQGAIYKTLAQASAAGVVIANCTQVMHGSVDAHRYSAGSWLAEVGVIHLADMTAIAALVKLSILLSEADFHGWSLTGVKHLLPLSLVGEVSKLGAS